VFKELMLGCGVRIGEKRVARLMRQAGLVAIHTRKPKGSTRRASERPLAPDLVQRDFAVDGPDRLLVADFTQLTTWTGMAYIAVVADAYSRLCLGWVSWRGLTDREMIAAQRPLRREAPRDMLYAAIDIHKQVPPEFDSS
jgi:transposase InsO family protein